MKKSYLNKAQKAWLNEFLSTRPNNRFQVYTVDRGTRTVHIEWSEKSNIAILDSHTYIATNIQHKIIVTLRMSGNPIKDGEYSFIIKPPQKYRVSYTLRGQFTLDLHTNYIVRFPKNPIAVKRRNLIKSDKNQSKRIVQQQTLTLDKYTQKLQDVNYNKTKTIISKEELLKISATSDTKLPSVIISIFRDKNADEDEFMIATQAYISGGVKSVLDYLEVIEQLRISRK